MRAFHDVMSVADITTHMTQQLYKYDNWRPSNPTVRCSNKPCYPPDPRDRGENAQHSHVAIPMLVPIAVSCVIVMGNIRVME